MYFGLIAGRVEYLNVIKIIARKIISSVMYTFPLSVVRWLIKILPRLSVCAPPGLVLQSPSYLGEFKVMIDTLYPIERKMLTGEYEKMTLKVIDNCVRPGDVCFDIGANVGPITFALVKATTPRGKVYAFEPGPPIYQRLVNNIVMNPLYQESIIAENLGMGDSPGVLLWAEDLRPEGRGNAGLRSGSGVPVKVTTLDCYCQKYGIDRINFIKIDVEGMEYEVLKGSEMVLRNMKPLVYFESLAEFDASSGYTFFESIEKYFNKLGYVFYSVNSFGKIRQTDNIGSTAYTLAVPKNVQFSDNF